MANVPAQRPPQKPGKIHLELLRRIDKGATVIPMNGGMFRFNRGTNMYAQFLLEELRAAKMLTSDNRVTAEGTIWLTLNS